MSLQQQNLLLDEIAYKIDRTSWGTWRRFLYPDGRLFAEFVSHRRVLGLPLFHYTRGISPETGRRVIARGVVAVGRFAVGGLAIGQASAGVIAIGQASLGILFGFGQAATGLFALGQLAIAIIVGIGQFATGYVAIGQVAFGWYVLAQLGQGRFVWDTSTAAPAAKEFFERLIPWR
jgi:hypothetical protein